MAKRMKMICRWPHCGALANKCGYCAAHAGAAAAEQLRRAKAADMRRGSSRQRGYSARWDRYSKLFLAQPQNQFCALRLDAGCAIIAQCVDHIDPPDSASDARFWDPRNHQPACIHCNSVKGHRSIVGKFGAPGV